MEEIPSGPRGVLLVLILLTAVLVPLLSPTVGIVAVIALCVAAMRRDLFNVGRTLSRLFLILGQFITYGGRAADAPGVWMPEDRVGTRRWAVWRLAGALFLSLTVGLDMFCPVDLFENMFERDFHSRQDAERRLRNEWGVNLSLSDEGRSSWFDRDALYRKPYGWVGHVLEGMGMKARYGWILIGVVVLLYTVPVFVLLTLYSNAIDAVFELRQRVEEAADVDDRPRWQWYVDRVRGSLHESTDPVTGAPIREAEHLYTGVEPYAQFPILLHEKILSEHCYIVGDSGSGKTSLGIMPILFQLMRGRAEPRGSMTPPPPIVILDLKGDPALFHALRHESDCRRQQAGITDENDPRYAFRFFTPEKNKASHYFNPFQSFASEARSDIQLCHLFLDALNLNHGEGYGRSYYSRRNRMLLFEALTSDPKPTSILELSERIARLIKGKRDPDRPIGQRYPQHAAFELVSTIQALAHYPMLATAGNVEHPEEAISMPELIEHRQVAYFWLPAALESISVREIGKLALFALLTAAIDRQRAGKEGRQVYMVIDEFQRIAGENFKVVLEQARSFKIAAVLANQTQGDLRTHDIDLRPTIRANTRAKLYFSLADPDEIRVLSEMSGEEIAILMGPEGKRRGGNEEPPRPWADWLKPRLTRNDILRMSDHPLEYVLQVSRGEGYSQFAGLPLICRTRYPLDKKPYDDLQSAEWPKGRIHTVVSPKTPKEHDAEFKVESQRELAKLFPEPSE